MRSIAALVALVFFAPSSLSAQAPAPSAELPKDPRAVFAAAAPSYDFASPNLKPWHFKVSYQLYDPQGNPSTQGTFEYWFASPKVYRTSWTRPDGSHTDWYDAEGNHSFLNSGPTLSVFERKLYDILLKPVPADDRLDPEKVRLYREAKSIGGASFACIETIPQMQLHGQVQAVPLGLFPTYCFDSHLPVLRITYSYGGLSTEYNKIVKVQDHYLSKELAIFEGNRKVLTAAVDSVNGVLATDPAFTPAAGSSVLHPSARIPIDEASSTQMLIKKVSPVYPQDGKAAHITGKVVLKATIGVDGAIHDMEVVSAPGPSFAASALTAVSQWQYKPYHLNGEPVEVETTINVIFDMR
jgi:TonB family protein